MAIRPYRILVMTMWFIHLKRAVSNANLEGAVITNTDLSGVILRGTVMLDGSIND